MRYLSKLAWSAAVGGLLAGGCSTADVPHTDRFPSTGQRKAKAVHHWDVLAQDVAARMADKISEWPAGAYPLYVQAASDSSFQQGFRKLLVARMLDRGVVMATEPGAVELQIDTQVVQHGHAVDHQRLESGTTVVSGVAVARAIGLPERNGASHAAPASARRTEVLVTGTLVNGGRYLASTSDIYYIEPTEAALYQSVRAAPLPPVKHWQVVVP